MTLMSHALRGWWRYFKLTFLSVGTTAIVALCLWVPAVIQRQPLQFVFAITLTTLWLVCIVWGAVNAHRARRHGCW